MDEIKGVFRLELEKFNSNNSTTLYSISIESLLSETESNPPIELLNWYQIVLVVL